MNVSSEPYKNTLPPPFQRPKIEISAAKRSWQWVLPEVLSKDDIVPDMGLIDSVYVYTGDDQPISVLIVSANGEHTVPTKVEIFAFTRTPT